MHGSSFRVATLRKHLQKVELYEIKNKKNYTNLKIALKLSF